MDEIAFLIEERHGVRVNDNFTGSATLLSQMELTGVGLFSRTASHAPSMQTTKRAL